MSSKATLVACCLVLTSSRLFTCHEDVQTGFIRTLAAGNVIDISNVYTDTEYSQYCVIVSTVLKYSDLKQDYC